MPIGTLGSTGAAIPAGAQVRFRIDAATFHEDGLYGPDIELELDVITEEYFGTTIRYWAKISRPRLDKVARLRGEGLDDETIASLLRKKSFEFEDLDEADEMLVSQGGALYKILTAGQGDVRQAEKVLSRVDTFEELADELVGTTFVGTTGVKNGYAKLDAREDICADMEDKDSLSAEDLDEIPFD